MLWIAGADSFGGALAGLHGGPFIQSAAREFEHSPWQGFTFYDLIFPLFVFLVGVSIPFSLRRIAQEEGTAAALRRVARRALLMYALGLFYYGGFAYPVDHFRFMGVLQRLAFCYLFGSILFLAVRPSRLWIPLASLLVGYWLLMTYLPVPGYGAGDFAEGHNLANWVDRIWLGGRKHDGDHDVEGILSTLPAIGSCLMGLMAGIFLGRLDRTDRQKAGRLALAGVICLGLGFLWARQFPIIKKLWTSSFVLVAGGWSLLLLAAFFWVIEVRHWGRWTKPFVWVGTNALTIYLLSNIVDFKKLAVRFCGGDLAAMLDRLRPGLSLVAVTLASVGLCLLVARFLYRRKIFLRL